MFNRILVPIDLAHKEQIPHLLSIAKRLSTPEVSDICMLYVDKSLEHRAGNPQIDEGIYRNHIHETTQQMSKLLSQLDLKDINAYARVREGTVHDQILEEIRENNIDAVVMMASKPGLANYFIGSSAERVVRHAGCSVFVIRN